MSPATDTAAATADGLDRVRAALATVVAIPVTPFRPDGAVDEAAHTVLLDRLTEGGVTALTPNGNTGEFYALSPAERRALVARTVTAAPRSLVVAGVGLDLATAAEDARAARDAGAGCVMVHQPPHPFRSLDGWVDYHAAIAAAVPDIGMVPYVKDPAVDAAAMSALASACPTLVGVKYAVPDPARFADLVAHTEGARATWLCGAAETWAPFFAIAGATGFTSGLVGVDPARSLRLLAALRAGDMGAAMAEWRGVRGFEDLRLRSGAENNVSVVKEALHQLGLCSRDVRPPITPLRAADAAAVADILAEWGLSRGCTRPGGR
ncbi:4-hydroxy-tetrahydrodipicolinate synthase [Murinocardiopsis flavida]|uniref:4-hydroxy-tetrahydrodipicolinate synthase n=1 Tax=Murinocardiopsis flavida TaxID=645275 RepID=A0A2P8CXH3_9ACTN|nr:dihydrodipicolinate synthase family protein [Murinocardiopsis flavida]PSK89616.1 4-hydroxy-tetrahydrodipicolinate synthase [Murinocardiopsis flavida]